jgi:hypothetical protein
MAKEPVVWAIAFISPKKMFTVERDLLKHSNRYKGVKAYIPVVKIMTKQVKGKQHFETVPMLFNYAFFKIPKYYIPNPAFLEKMKKDVECIINWVKDPSISKEKGYFTMDKLYNPTGVALASQKDIDNLREREKGKTFYTASDIKSLKEGATITLHTYPFEGLPAEIIKVNEDQGYVTVRLLLETSLQVIKVKFENVFFTIYKDVYLEDKMREEYIDEMKARNKGVGDKIDFNNKPQDNE